MGEISKRLRLRLSDYTSSPPAVPRKRRPGESLPGGIKDVEMLINDGLDPIHAAYAYLQQITSHFAEGASQLPEMAAFVKAVVAAEEEYLPSGPPMSPLTTSYFWTWALYDLRFGKSKDTVVSCQIELQDILGFSDDQLDALLKCRDSRMGIYEHVGLEGNMVRLREILTDNEFVCHSWSDYLGSKGQLWYVRLLPPLMPDQATYHICFTTPYVLMGATKEDWLDFLRRTLLSLQGKAEKENLHHLMKYGPSKHYWHEFVLKAYLHHQDDAVFLTGLPAAGLTR